MPALFASAWNGALPLGSTGGIVIGSLATTSPFTLRNSNVTLSESLRFV